MQKLDAAMRDHMQVAIELGTDNLDRSLAGNVLNELVAFSNDIENGRRQAAKRAGNMTQILCNDDVLEFTQRLK